MKVQVSLGCETYTVTGLFTKATRSTYECPGDPAEFEIEGIETDDGPVSDEVFNALVENDDFYISVLDEAEENYGNGVGGEDDYDVKYDYDGWY